MYVREYLYLPPSSYFDKISAIYRGIYDAIMVDRIWALLWIHYRAPVRQCTGQTDMRYYADYKMTI